MSRHAVLVRDTRQLGAFTRAVRKAQRLRQDEIGRFSHSFILDLENGKPTAQVGKVLDALVELGVTVRLEAPAGLDVATLERYLRESSLALDSSAKADDAR